MVRYGQSGYLYLMETKQESVFKIGHTSNPLTRLQVLKSDVDYLCTSILLSVWVRDARNCEMQMLHACKSNCDNIRSESFVISRDVLDTIIRKMLLMSYISVIDGIRSTNIDLLFSLPERTNKSLFFDTLNIIKWNADKFSKMKYPPNLDFFVTSIDELKPATEYHQHSLGEILERLMSGFSKIDF